MGLLNAIGEHGGAHCHAVQTLVQGRRRRAAAVVDVACKARCLVELQPQQIDGRNVAVVAAFIVFAGQHVGVDQATPINKALHVVHADVALLLLEDEGAVVGVVIWHRPRAALLGFRRQRPVQQPWLHAIPGPNAHAHHIGQFGGVVTMATGIGRHGRRIREK